MWLSHQPITCQQHGSKKKKITIRAWVNNSDLSECWCHRLVCVFDAPLWFSCEISSPSLPNGAEGKKRKHPLLWAKTKVCCRWERTGQTGTGWSHQESYSENSNNHSLQPWWAEKHRATCEMPRLLPYLLYQQKTITLRKLFQRPGGYRTNGQINELEQILSGWCQGF